MPDTHLPLQVPNPHRARPAWLPVERFPPVHQALDEPNGLLAIGGDLSPGRLLDAYRHGIFPWFMDDEPVAWWSPDPRAVLFPERLHVGRSLRRCLNRGHFRVSLDRDFAAVIDHCAAPRASSSGQTWITGSMRAAYLRLHRLGHAHSVECWFGDTLVGGLYGVAIGKAFAGESMFSRKADASKVALVCLTRQLAAWGFRLIDCQVPSDHVVRLGGTEIPRADFIARWSSAAAEPDHTDWRFDRALVPLGLDP